MPIHYFIGKEEVGSSNLLNSSIEKPLKTLDFQGFFDCFTSLRYTLDLTYFNVNLHTFMSKGMQKGMQKYMVLWYAKGMQKALFSVCYLSGFCLHISIEFGSSPEAFKEPLSAFVPVSINIPFRF